MTEICLREDKLPAPLPVILSPTINYEINEIEYLNWRKTDEIHKWHDYLDRVLRYISNPSIAWDYAGRYRHLPNGETYINEIGYDVGFIIEANDTQTYVKVFRLALNAEEYGLQMPSNEGRKYNNTHKQYNIMNNTKKRIRLTESQLHRLIKEVINEALQSSDFNEYGVIYPINFDKYQRKGSPEIMHATGPNGEYGVQWRSSRHFGEPSEFDVREDPLFKARSPFFTPEQFDDAIAYGRQRGWANTEEEANAYLADKEKVKQANKESKYYKLTNQNFFMQNGEHTPGKWCWGEMCGMGAVPASPDFETVDDALAYGREKGYIQSPVNESIRRAIRKVLR